MPFLVTKNGTPELTYSQTRRASLRTPTRGVRTAAQAATWLDDVAAVALTLPPGAAFSHTTAAQLLGLPTPWPDGRPLHVTVPRAVNRGRRKAVAWHQRDLTGCTLRAGGFAVTDHARTWVDLGAVLTMPDLVAVTDVMLRRGLVRVADLQIAPGTRGVATLREALMLADPDSRSVRESLLRVQLHSSGLPAPRINMDIIEEGIWLGCGDLVWPEFTLVIEYDGIHHDSQRQRHQDAQTRNAYAEHGWECLVLTNWHFGHMHDSIEMIARVMRQRGWHGTV